MNGLSNGLSTFLNIEVNVFCLIIIAMTFVFTVKLFKKQGWKRPKEAVMTAGMICVALLSDILYWLLGYLGKLNPACVYILRGIYFSAMIATSAAYISYIIFRLRFMRRDKGTASIMIWMPAMMIIIMTITTPVNKLFYYANADGSFVRGAFFHVYTAIQLGYFIIGAILSIYRYKHEEFKQDLYISMGLFIFAIPASIFFIIQAFTTYNAYSVGITISSLSFSASMIYGQCRNAYRIMNEIGEQLDEERKYTKYFMVSYFGCFYVDLNTHEFKVYAGDVSEYENLDDFFVFAKSYCANIVAGEDGVSIMNLLKPDLIRNILKGDNEYQIIVRDAHKADSQKYIMMHFVRGEDENHVAIGFNDVDSVVRRRHIEQRRLDHSHQVIEMLGGVVEARNLESGEHIQRVKRYTRAICEFLMANNPECGLDFHKVELISSASALHDVGKIMIRDNILLKPEKLTEEEFEAIKTHTTIGCQLIQKMMDGSDEEYYKYCCEIALNHHEKYDGRGYPNGLKGEEIPLSAQIVSLADVLDALTSKRVYKDAYPFDEAFKMILDGECGAYSERLLGSFVKAKDKLYELSQKMGTSPY